MLCFVDGDGFCLWEWGAEVKCVMVILVTSSFKSVFSAPPPNSMLSVSFASEVVVTICEMCTV